MKESAESEKGIDQVNDSKKDKVVADRAVKLMLSKYIFVSKLLRQIKEIPKTFANLTLTGVLENNWKVVIDWQCADNTSGSMVAI